MKKLFSSHLVQIQAVLQNLLEQARLDGLWIYSGEAKRYFLDDQTAPFKANPYFNYLFPMPTAEQCWIYWDSKQKPQIYFYAPEDYWHSTPNPPLDHFFASEFEWHILTEAKQITQYLQNPRHTAFIGEDEKLAQALGFEQINPQKILNGLNFARSAKSEFEIECIYQAQLLALKGHQAALDAFLNGKSEFEINLAYLLASRQSDTTVPYGNIIATDQHGAILHYTDKQFKAGHHQSLLIDAGASYLGYASDITRTYVSDSNSSAASGEFYELICKMEQLKQKCIANLTLGVNYLHYHTQMQQWIAELLYEFDFVRMSPLQIFEEGISRAFFPHGLGHQLGLQVHDVAGFQQNARGTHKTPPEIYPSLRCTRDLSENMLLTIEPGFYFIEMLQKPYRNSPLAKYFNWQKLEAFKQFGGIRVEDNIVMRSFGAENLTDRAIQSLQKERS